MKKPYNLIRYFLLLFNLVTLCFCGYSIYLNPSHDLFLNVLMASFIYLIVGFMTLIFFYTISDLQKQENELERKKNESK